MKIWYRFLDPLKDLQIQDTRDQFHLKKKTLSVNLM